MKVRTKKDIVKLNDKIKEDLGIDVQKYRNEKVIANFVDLLIFPKYVISWGVRPILISILLFITGFFILNLVHIEYLIYTIIGLILFVVNGALTAVLFLIWKIKSDIWGVVAYSLEIMKSAITDVIKVNKQVSKENRKDVLGLLFKGIIHIVTIPMVSKVVSDKVPFVSGIVNSVIARILRLMSNKVTFNQEKITVELYEEQDQSKLLKLYIKSISMTNKGLGKVVDIVFGIVQLPIWLVFGVILTLLMLFLYLIN